MKTVITPERVMRDLERGVTVRASWAPAAVAALVAEGKVRVGAGWVLPAGLDAAGWRRLKTRGARSWGRARARQDTARAALPSTVARLVPLLGLTPAGVKYVLKQVGACVIDSVYVPEDGYRRPRARWGIP